MSTGTQAFPPSEFAQSNNVKTDFKSCTALTEESYVLEDNVNQLFIKSRSSNILKISFVSGDIALGKYWTIPKGCGESILSIDFIGKILYIEASTTCEIEVMQLYTI